MEDSKRTCRLSFEKLKSFIEGFSYTIERLFCQKNKIIFLECKTPNYQKSFIVQIPEESYNVKLSYRDNESGRRSRIPVTQITRSSLMPTKYQIQFITNIKSHNLTSDLVTISSDEVLFYSDTSNPKLYHLREDDGKEEIMGNESSNNTSDLGRQAAELMRKLDPHSTLPKVRTSKRQKKEDRKRFKKGILLNPNETPLIAEDSLKDNTTSNEDLSNKKIEEKVPPLGIEEKEEVKEESSSRKKEVKIEEPSEKKEDIPPEGGEDKKEVPPPPKEEESTETVELFFEKDEKEDIDEVQLAVKNSNLEIQSGYNSFPSKLEDGNISLGLIFISVSIRNFHTLMKKSNFETELLKEYQQIEENENETRNEKMDKIRGMCQNFSLHMAKKVSELTSDEDKLKDQLLILTVVMTQASILKRKVEHDPNKYSSEDINDTFHVYNKTKDMIDELNIEILRLRDTTEELLSNYLSTMEEIFAL